MKNFVRKKDKRYKSVLTNRQIYDRYKKPDDKYLRLFNLLQSNYKLFRLVTKFSEIHWKEESIDTLIKKYTLSSTSQKDLDDYINEVTKNFKDLKIEQTKHGYSVQLDDKEIRFIKATKMFPMLLNFIPSAESERRRGKCHWLSVRLSLLMSLSGIKNELVSGYIYEIIEDAPYSHTWVEFEDDSGKAVVADLTMGAIINKDGYYAIKHPTNLSRISQQDVVRESKIFEKFDKVANGWANKVYFHDRETALKLYEEYFGELEIIEYEDFLKYPELIFNHKAEEESNEEHKQSQKYQ